MFFGAIVNFFTKFSGFISRAVLWGAFVRMDVAKRGEFIFGFTLD